jgi:hypothetical protein
VASFNFDFPVDARLQAVAMGYKWPDGIADLVLPRVPVDSIVFKWWEAESDDLLRVHNTRVGRKSAPKEIDYKMTEKTAAVEAYGLAAVIPNLDSAPGVAPSWFQPRAAKIKAIMKGVEIDREKRCADLLFNAATYPTGNKETLSGSDQFSDPTSDPLRIIEERMLDMPMLPNTLVFNNRGWREFINNPNVTAQLVPSTSINSPTVNARGPQATMEAVKDRLGVTNIFIGKSKVNTAAPGLTVSRSDMWGNHLAMYLLDPDALSPSAESITFGFSPQYGTRIAGTTPDPKIGLLGGEYVKAGEFITELICASDLGYLFSNIIA